MQIIYKIINEEFQFQILCGMRQNRTLFMEERESEEGKKWIQWGLSLEKNEMNDYFVGFKICVWQTPIQVNLNYSYNKGEIAQIQFFYFLLYFIVFYCIFFDLTNTKLKWILKI